jgi:hypothetical protein
MAIPTGSNVQIQLPVKVDYKVIDAFLEKKFQGKVLSKGKANGETSDHARIQHVSVEKSPLEDFDLALHLKLQLLTTFFRNKEIQLVVHLALAFQEKTQELSIQKYELDGENNSWVINKLLETLVNNFLYEKLKQKMKVDLKPILEKQTGKINEKLVNGTEIQQGIHLSGHVSKFSVNEIIPGQKYLLVSLNLLSNNVVNIQELDF